MPQRNQLIAALSQGARGVVIRRQSTFWDLALEGGALAAPGQAWRIGFRRRIEASQPSAPFTTVSFHRDHPLLADHQQPWTDVFVAGIVPDPPALLAVIDAAFLEVSCGWRSAERYLNAVATVVLQTGSGLLFSAPSGYASHVEAALSHSGLSFSNFSRRPAQASREVVLLGCTYIIAESFAVAPAPPNPGMQRTRYARR